MQKTISNTVHKPSKLNKRNKVNNVNQLHRQK